MTQQSLPEESIFLRALDIPSEAERSEYLEQACSGNASLRAEVEALLLAHRKSGDLLDLPDSSASTSEQPLTEQPGTQIGPYKLLELIGEGGMGVVYMAEQKEPVKRRVALKIIKPGMDTRQVIARFEAERQALAIMDHPNIAKVLDAGATESGRPYFVMELVNGLPVTRYCDEQHLTPTERLELFIPICQAVQHAHQKGIIHRDLKPGNILIALYDGQAVPKIIDFGVAKATSQTLTEKTMFTQLGQVVGTLEYMSPEQAERNQLDIDTRSDIYSLGVVLYELLTGEPPFDRERLRSAALEEMLRIIREEEPSKPSTKVSSSQSLPSIAANRRVEPAKLGNFIRGELDWIVLKAMEKDRSRRYDTASKFAEDVQHYLSGQPVTACPPSTTYRFRKFAQRNKASLVTAVVLAISLSVGFGIATWQAVRANRAEKLANQRLQDVKAEKQNAVRNFEQAERQRIRSETTIRLILDACEESFLPLAATELTGEGNLSDESRRFLESLLPFYDALGVGATADRNRQAALARANLRIGHIYKNLKIAERERIEKGEPVLRRGIKLLESLRREVPEKAWQDELQLANGYFDLAELICHERPHEAMAAFRRSISTLESIFDRLPDAERYRLPRVQFIYAARLTQILERYQEALTLNRQSLKRSEALLAEFPEFDWHAALVAQNLTYIGWLHAKTGRPELREEYVRRAIAITEPWVREHRNQPHTAFELAMAYSGLGTILQASRRLSESEAALVKGREIFAQLVQTSGEDRNWVQRNYAANNLRPLAQLYESQNRIGEAIVMWRSAVDLAEQVTPELPHGDWSRVADRYRRRLIPLLIRDERRAEARRELESFEPRSVGDYYDVARWYAKIGDLEVAVARLKSAPKTDSDGISEVHNRIVSGDIYHLAGYSEEAAAQWAAALNQNFAPIADYRIHIATPGTYRLYVRWASRGGPHTGVYVQVPDLSDGPCGDVADFYYLDADSDIGGHDLDFETTPWTGVADFEHSGNRRWGPRTNWHPTVWTFPQAGHYTIRFIMRKPGVAIDALILQLDILAPPNSDSLTESRRAADGTFLEHDGLVVIEAEHFSSRQSATPYEWKHIRTDSPTAESSTGVRCVNSQGDGYLQVLPEDGRPISVGRRTLSDDEIRRLARLTRQERMRASSMAEQSTGPHPGTNENSDKSVAEPDRAADVP